MIQKTCHPRKKSRVWSHMQRTKDYNFSWAVMQTPTMRCGVAPTLTRGERAYWTLSCAPSYTYYIEVKNQPSWTQEDKQCWILHCVQGVYLVWWGTGRFVVNPSDGITGRYLYLGTNSNTKEMRTQPRTHKLDGLQGWTWESTEKSPQQILL